MRFFSPFLLMLPDVRNPGLEDLKVAPQWFEPEITDDVVADIIDAIDIDRSGDIQEQEFVAWMEVNVSHVKLLLVVSKIVLGLGQVVSKQPETMMQDFHSDFFDWKFFKTFSLDFNWVMPICQISYISSFFFNVLVYPGVAWLLVWLTWVMNDRHLADEMRRKLEQRPIGNCDSQCQDNRTLCYLALNAGIDADQVRKSAENVSEEQAKKALIELVVANKKGLAMSLQTLEAHGKRLNIHGDQVPESMHHFHEHDEHEENNPRYSDYYFAFFLCYPTMTQTFFQHFNCRQLPEKSVLQADYDIVCWDWTHEDGGKVWYLLAIVAVVGLITVSFGFPLGMWWKMRNRWTSEMSECRHKKKPYVVAVRDFSVSFVVRRVPRCGFFCL